MDHPKCVCGLGLQAKVFGVGLDEKDLVRVIFVYMFGYST
jgi:hypothetical protein